MKDIGELYNQTEEINASNAYPTIRVMTTSGQTSGPPTPRDFVSLQQPWAVASNATIPNFSAVCWFFARRLQDAWVAAGVPPLPLGLLSNNIGGTGIGLWSSNTTLTACGTPQYVPPQPNPNPSNGPLYDQLIAPLTTGPTFITGMIWFQAEADAPPYGYSPLWYACMIKALILDWRGSIGGGGGGGGGGRGSSSPSPSPSPWWFGFTQLAPFYSGMDWGHGADGWQDIRQAQLAALDLPSVGFASAVDIGDPLSPLGSYHPRNKKAVGTRLADSALAMVYGDGSVVWRGPQVVSADAVQTGASVGSTITVTATFEHCSDGAGGGGLQFRDYQCPTSLGVDASTCGEFSVWVTPGTPPPTTNWSYLGGGFLGTAGGPCHPPGPPINHTVASAQSACNALPVGSATCPQGCKGFTWISNVTGDPGVALPTTFCSVLDFFPETGRDVNWQAWGSDYDPMGVRLVGGGGVIGGPGNSTLTFSAQTLMDGQRVVAAGVGWATWPVSVLMNGKGLPMIPWLTRNVSVVEDGRLL